MEWSGWFAIIGLIAIAAALIVVGLLSKRMGEATRAAPFYLGFFLAALLVLVSIVARAANLLLRLVPMNRLLEDPLWILLYNGLPALGLTLGVIFAWRYWSWLLAERD